MALEFPDWLGDLYQVEALSPQAVGVIILLVSGLCGALVGLERERRDKPAGLRTLILISMGSTLFTMASLLVAEGVGFADRGRVAAQVVTGIGFLGAGAIIHERRAVVGLTTAATIWVVAAVGVIVGAGYAAAGVTTAGLIYVVLTFVKELEARVSDPCDLATVRVEYRANNGKTRLMIIGILDDHQIPDGDFSFLGPTSDGPGTAEVFEVSYCTRHRIHRTVLPEIARLEEVTAVKERDAERPLVRS